MVSGQDLRALERKVNEALEQIEGRSAEGVWAMVIACPLGSEARERVPIEKTLITRDGRLVFVSVPYPNLAEEAEK